jgi:hypothetical protein
MNQKQAFYIISAVILVLFASLGYTIIQLNSLEKTINEQNEAITQLDDELKPYTTLYNLLKDKPDTSFISGLEVVSGSTISYSHDLTKETPNRYSYNHYSIFYAPIENTTLHIVSGKLLPKDDFPFPLTLQKGNAVLNETGEIVKTYTVFNKTITEWQSPVIWQKNVTGTESIDIVLDDVGWYTLSMTGPIRKTSSGATSYRFFIGVDESIQVADIWIDYRLYYDEEIVLFGLWTR